MNSEHQAKKIVFRRISMVAIAAAAVAAAMFSPGHRDAAQAGGSCNASAEGVRRTVLRYFSHHASETVVEHGINMAPYPCNAGDHEAGTLSQLRGARYKGGTANMFSEAAPSGTVYGIYDPNGSGESARFCSDGRVYSNDVLCQ